MMRVMKPPLRKLLRAVTLAFAVVLGSVTALLLGTRQGRGEIAHEAACHGWSRVVGLFNSMGVDPNGNDFGVFGPPLMCAAFNGHGDVVARLLAAGANPRAGCCLGTPLDSAAHSGDLAIVKQLVAAGAAPWEGFPLGAAAFRGDEAMVRFLLANGARWWSPDSKRNAIEIARAEGHESVALLIEATVRPSGTQPR